MLDQIVDRTKERRDTYFDGPVATHITLQEPYCPVLREMAIEAARVEGLPLHERGTVVVIEGPRFSTLVESKWYASNGWEVVNMTQYPEVALARERQIADQYSDFLVYVPEHARSTVVATECLR